MSLSDSEPSVSYSVIGIWSVSIFLTSESVDPGLSDSINWFISKNGLLCGRQRENTNVIECRTHLSAPRWPDPSDEIRPFCVLLYIRVLCSGWLVMWFSLVLSVYWLDKDLGVCFFGGMQTFASELYIWMGEVRFRSRSASCSGRSRGQRFDFDGRNLICRV